MISKICRFIFMRFQYYILTFFNYVIPKNKEYIFIFDKKFKKDNVWAISDYLAHNDNGKRYNIYYYTDTVNESYSNIIFINNPIFALWKQMRSKYIFYSYRGDGIKIFKSAGDQIIVDTMHGSPLKNIGYLASKSRFNKLWKYEDSFDFILCVSDFFKEIVKKSFGANEEQCIVLGYPRNDIIFKEENTLDSINIMKGEYSKIILWVPTWRESINGEKNNESNKEFPILDLDNIGLLNDYLLNANILLIIKPHPFQLDLEIFHGIHSNIKIIKNHDLQQNKIEFYQLFTEVDALLTDYSSVYFDFLLTMKPIGFTIDDFDCYRDKRGFVVDSPLEIMPGDKITNLEELIIFITGIKENRDKFYTERKAINDLANKYKDGNSTKRIIEFLGM